MKKITAIVLIMVMLILASCTPSNVQTDDITPTATVTEAPSQAPTATPTAALSQLSWETSGEWLAEKYPDKKCLDWYIYGGFGNLPVTFLQKLNEELDAKGYDFYVNIVGISWMLSLDDFWDNVMIDNPDIISFGVEAYGTDVYYMGYQKDIFASLDDYLETETGKKLWNAYDEKYWESLKINGKIYGLETDASALASTVALFIRNDALEMAQIKADDFTYDYEKDRPLYEKLKQAMNSISGEPNTAHNAVSSIAGAPSIENMTCLFGAIGFDETNPNGAFENIYENEKIIQHLYAVASLYSDGTFTQNESILLGNGASAIRLTTPMYIAQYDINASKAGNIETTAIELFTEKVVSATMKTVSINKHSENKDEAFELLALMHTDENLANKLVYGEEGVDYVIENGIVCWPETSQQENNVSAMATKFFPESLCLPKDETGIFTYKKAVFVEDISEMTKEYNEALELSAICGFHYDASGKHKETIQKILQIISQKNNSIWWCNTGDIEEQLVQLNTELKEAGIDELIADMNVQLAEWRKVTGK
ncbi:MAG: DUF3502 domain-containing protein [Ruminococcaceae bacterium]|nr:DUF3502 domain-containing protein [Oscillospiraceae bacterium]